MDESRKQFEEWAVRGLSSETLKRTILDIGWNDDYRQNVTRIRWEAWKASRQALQDNQKGE